MAKLKKCRECGETISALERPNGEPNALGFELEDGSIYWICIKCFNKWREGKVSKDTKDAIDGGL